MTLMTLRDFRDLSLAEMRLEFSRATTAIARNAYNRTRDTDSDVYKALWGERKTAKQIEKELLDAAEENEKMRYIEAYNNLINKYGDSFTIESRDKVVNAAIKMFPGNTVAQAIKKLKEQDKYLNDPEIRKILKMDNTEDDSVMSDLIREYVSIDYELFKSSGMNTVELAAKEKEYSSSAEFKNYLLSEINRKKAELINQ